jgi:anaerobic ribonucleoside-triphosphate reductase activating protein
LYNKPNEGDLREMNYHNITKDDMLNGDGLRVVLWVSGCTHHCHNCQNPITWDIAGGLPFDEAAEKELFEALAKPHCSGITFSGGDPLHPFNREEVFRLMKKIRQELPNKTIWLYTGFLWEEIKDIPDIADIDVLCEGKFVEALLDNNLHWVGSSNQRVMDVKKSLATGEVVLHE